MTRTLGVALAILAAGYLAAGCVSGGVKSALPSVSASGSISFSSPTVSLPHSLASHAPVEDAVPQSFRRPAIGDRLS